MVHWESSLGRSLCDGCRLTRRCLLTAGSACAGVLWTGFRGLAQPAESASPQEKDSGTLWAAFVRPDVEKYGLGWPGAVYDVKTRTAEYTQLLTKTAADLGITCHLEAKPLWDDESWEVFVRKLQEAKPVGLILVLQHLDHNVKGLCGKLEKLAFVPTLVFSQMGTSFHEHFLMIRQLGQRQRLYFASTWDGQWLASAVRIFYALSEMRQTRICVVQGQAPQDILLESVGVTLRYIPFQRFSEEYAQTKETEEVRELAERWAKNAEKITEPSKQEIVEAAKTYVVCQRLMKQTDCQGIAVDCLPHVSARTAPPPCMAFMQLNDTGVVAACQADWPAAISLRLVWLLLGRPGFMNNMCSSSLNNTMMGAHCSSPIFLAGPGQAPAPYRLRSHAESGWGVAPQVIWPTNEKITILKFSDPLWSRSPRSGREAAQTIWLAAGQILRNIDTPPAGGCRTSMEIQLEGCTDISQMRMLHHMLYVLGDHRDKIRAYCALAGIQLESLFG
jgi:hypothetical protein